MWDATAILNALTPKFYVALTGTSSLISGLILIFEWWYFRKYGVSFIEQVSLSQLAPWTWGSGGGGSAAGGGGNAAGGAAAPADCKVWRNPMCLLRGAEYARLWAARGLAPLTYYDMNLSAQEHQAWFGTGGTAEEEALLSRAWRERSPMARVAAARAALALRPDCAPALLLLAEEDAPTVQEAERLLKLALRAAEASLRSSAGTNPAEARRAAAVAGAARRRLAECARRLGRLRDATRMFRELARDAPPPHNAHNAHENLIEVLLEQKAYADVQAVLARYDDISLPKSATICYTAALVRCRAAAAASAGGAGSGARGAEHGAMEALRRALEFNPHVPDYLLELRPLTLPPEHVLKRGDSEALAYAFWHLRHWKNAEGALRLLATAVEERARCPPAPRLFHPYPACSACADRELLPAHHVPGAAGGGAGAGAGRGALPAAAACALTAAAALLAHHYPALLSGRAPPRPTAPLAPPGPPPVADDDTTSTLASLLTFV